MVKQQSDISSVGYPESDKSVIHINMNNDKNKKIQKRESFSTNLGSLPGSIKGDNTPVINQKTSSISSQSDQNLAYKGQQGYDHQKENNNKNNNKHQQNDNNVIQNVPHHPVQVHPKGGRTVNWPQIAIQPNQIILYHATNQFSTLHLIFIVHSSSVCFRAITDTFFVP